MGSLYGPTYGKRALCLCGRSKQMARRSNKGRKKVTQPRLRSTDDPSTTRSRSATTTGSEPPRPHRRQPNETVQLKLRFSEALRRQLEEAAASNQRSLNAEIIKRLEGSFLSPDRLPRLVADALLNGLDPDVITAMSETIIEDWQSDRAASLYDWREDQAYFEGK
jgi:Arc-like DNA binding dprotein